MLYLVDSVDNTKMYYSSDKCDNWTQLDIDPSDTSGDNKSRDHKIISAWHDRANEIIYFVDCDNDGTADDFDVWKLDYSGSETAPTATEIGTEPAGADANTVYVGDIFKIDANIYVINVEDRAGTTTTVVWDVDTAPFTEKDTNGAFANNPLGYGIGVKPSGDDKYWHIFDDNDGDCYISVYDASAEVWTPNTNFVGYSLPTENLRGAAYDGDNLIYFIVNKDGDGKNYLVTYSISGDSYTALDEFNVAIMVDRNTAAGIQEKGFHTSNYEVYQLHPTIGYQLHHLASPTLSGVIIAITDNFLMECGNMRMSLPTSQNVLSTVQIWISPLLDLG
jgi:hypothetical protein